MPEHHDVVIVGAGLAGLAAARTLVADGVDALVVEAADQVGGRIRTDRVDGLLLDRGFQLFNPAYPEAARVLDLAALDLRPFASGVVAMTPSGPARLGDPRSLPGWAGPSLAGRSGSILGKARFAAHALRVARADPRQLEGSPDGSALAALRAAGVDDRLLETVLRPFLAGVFLEPDLATSRRFLDLVLRSFVRGTPSVPAAGMQAIPGQLHDRLPAGSVRLNTRVRAVSGRAVTTEAGTIEASAVIVATDPPAAAGLVPGVPIPAGRAVTTWYFLADVPGAALTGGRAVLVVDGLGAVLNTVAMTNAAPSYASDGRVLVSASALGLHADDARVRLVQAHLSRLYGVDTAGWQHVGTYPIPYALPAMLPPLDTRQSVDLGGGVFIAGDHRDTASIQGALVSGRRAGAAVLRHLGRKVVR